MPLIRHLVVPCCFNRFRSTWCHYPLFTEVNKCQIHSRTCCNTHRQCSLESAVQKRAILCLIHIGVFPDADLYCSIVAAYETRFLIGNRSCFTLDIKRSELSLSASRNGRILKVQYCRVSCNVPSVPLRIHQDTLHSPLYANVFGTGLN